MQVRILRGATQIGGSCVEVEARGARVILDLGMPLDAPEDADLAALLPAVAGLREPDPSLLGVLLSHGHRDYWGLLPASGDHVPVWMGKATHRIMAAAEGWVPGVALPRDIRHMANRDTFTLGPFEITPYLTDHSAYDAYSLLIKADGRSILYTGDLRAHGRKGKLFDAFVARPPRGVDVMLMEGSTIGRPGSDAGWPTEAEIERALIERFRATSGMVLLACSAQNIDRMVSVFRACRQTRRTFLVDLYAAEMLRATGNPNIPTVGPNWPEMALFTPKSQRVRVVRNEMFEVLQRNAHRRVFPEALPALASRAVMLFRPFMLRDLEQACCLGGASAIWSQWSGYLTQPDNVALRERLDSLRIPMTVVHTSGHASVPDLKRLATAVAPRALVPIHTFRPQDYAGLFENVTIREDGEWWTV
jgi:ribonuclease J